jgi:hypothetical protein
MQDDDFDSGMDMPDEDLAGEPSETDLGDLGGAGDLETDSTEDEAGHRGTGGGRARSSPGSRKAAVKAAAPRKAAKKAARKGAAKKGAKKAARKGAKKGAKKAARKGGRKVGRGKK